MWYATYRINGKAVMKPTGVPVEQAGKTERQTRKEAQRQADAMESLAKGTSTIEAQIDALRAAAAANGSAAKMPTVAEYLQDMNMTGSAKTVYGKQRTNKVFLEYLGPDAVKRLDWVTKERAQAFIDEQCKRVSTETVKLYRTHLSTAFNRAIDTGLITKNPMRGTKIANLGKDALRRDALTADDVRKILAYAPQPWPDMVLVCLNTFGQRIGDIACLRWSGVDLQRGILSITTQKNKTPLSWPIMPVLMHRLRILHANRSGDYVFPDMARRYQCSAGSLSIEFTALLRMLGIAEDAAPADTTGNRRKVCSKSFHGLRRFAVTDTRKAGVAADLCRELVGHDSEEVERTYFRASMDDKRETLRGMFGRIGLDAYSPKRKTGRPARPAEDEEAAQ